MMDENTADVVTHARRRRQHGGVRMDEVARVAGVSAITVSRVLNHPGKVAETTRQRVWSAIEGTGYVPNLLAGGLASSRTRTIGVIIPTIINSIFADKIQGMADRLGAENYHLLLANSGYSLEVECQLVAALLAQRASGLVITGVHHAARTRQLLKRSGTPVVETWTRSAKPIDMLVGFSNEEAAYAMVRHLARAGYRKVGLVCAPTRDNDRALGRLKGYRRAVRDCGLVTDARLEREAAFSLHNGASALVSLVEEHPDMDAIFFANDILAAGGLFECARRGWAVPDRLGIAGFDDVDLAAQIVPALTTVRIPRYEIGARAAELILARLAGRQPTETIVDLGFEIIARQSTRAVDPESV
jgi:LacI family transcriptional regulator, gluconate utilization system Gnt-I transcriptional repressor